MSYDYENFRLFYFSNCLYIQWFTTSMYSNTITCAKFTIYGNLILPMSAHYDNKLTSSLNIVLNESYLLFLLSTLPTMFFHAII